MFRSLQRQMNLMLRALASYFYLWQTIYLFLYYHTAYGKIICIFNMGISDAFRLNAVENNIDNESAEYFCKVQMCIIKIGTPYLCICCVSYIIAVWGRKKLIFPFILSINISFVFNILLLVILIANTIGTNLISTTYLIVHIKFTLFKMWACSDYTF